MISLCRRMYNILKAWTAVNMRVQSCWLPESYTKYSPDGSIHLLWSFTRIKRMLPRPWITDVVYVLTYWRALLRTGESVALDIRIDQKPTLVSSGQPNGQTMATWPRPVWQMSRLDSPVLLVRRVPLIPKSASREEVHRAFRAFSAYMWRNKHLRS